MAQYLMTLLASRGMAGHGDPFGPAGPNFMMGGGEGTENGRWGDYVFNQEGTSKTPWPDIPVSYFRSASFGSNHIANHG